MLSGNDEHLLCHFSLEAKSKTINREVVKALSTTDSSGSVSLHFGCSHNAHDCIAMMYVIENIEKQCSVEINFRNCNLKAKQILRLASALDSGSNKIQVKGLDLSDNRLSDSVVVEFFNRAAAALLSLEKLILHNCGIGTKGVSAIMDVLSRASQSLTQLDLSFNPLSTSCLQTIQHHIDHGTLMKLEILFLKGSFTKDINLSCLVTFIDTLSSQCLHLRRLDLSENDLGKPGNPELSKMISQLTGLRNNFDLHLNSEYMSEVDNNFIGVMEESMRRKGTVDHTIAHGVIVGPGRSGKNTLMNRLMGEGPPDPDSKSSSTGVLENVVKVEVKKLSTVAASVNNLRWQRLKYDEEALELMMTTAKDYSVPSDESKPKYIVVKQPSESIGDVASSLSDLNSNASETTKLISEISKNTGYDSMSRDEKATKDSKVVVYSPDVAPVKIFKKALKLRHMDALREHLESSWSLYLTNTGGQIEFQELLPILVCGPSIFFITFPLHYDLMKPYEVQYEYPDGRVKKYLSTATLMDELLQTLATIYNSYISSDIKPRIFFVGTHKDCLPEFTAEETIQKIDEQLQRYVRQTSLFHQGSIQFAQSSERLIFTVNNLSKEDNDFLKIRLAVQQAIERKHCNDFTVKCPFSWLTLSLILRAKHKSNQVLRFEECYNIAQECGISNRIELSKALSFIHSKLGLVRYFNVEELNTLVVVDPQILFDKITDLIVNSLSSDHAEVNEIEDCRRGIFSVAVMERISKKCSSDLPFTWLIKLLNYLRIAALFTDSDGDKYFFPSVLCHVPELHSNQALPSDSPPILLVAFESGFCPRGIPGALIKCLMTNEIKSKRQWKLLPNRISRNQVSFRIQAYGGITLKTLPTHLEFCLDSEAVSTGGKSEAYMQIKEGMKIVTGQHRLSVCGYFFGFYCTLAECKAHPHPAKIEWHGHSPFKLYCKVAQKGGALPTGYDIWNIQKKRKKGIYACACIHSICLLLFTVLRYNTLGQRD